MPRILPEVQFLSSHRSSRTFLVTLLLVLTSSMAHGQARCDCDVIVKQCRAEVSEIPSKSVGPRFLVRADTEHCAIVEWSVDGDKGQTTVWDDGEEVTRVTPRKPGGSIEVQSCRVCKDRLMDSAAHERQSLPETIAKKGCEKVTDEGHRVICSTGDVLTIYCKSDGSAQTFRLPAPVNPPPRPAPGMSQEEYQRVNRSAIERFQAWRSARLTWSSGVENACKGN